MWSLYTSSYFALKLVAIVPIAGRIKSEFVNVLYPFLYFAESLYVVMTYVISDNMVSTSWSFDTDIYSLRYLLVIQYQL